VNEHEVYQVIGEDGFRRLTASFYRQVPLDTILGPMYQSADLAEAEERLRDFLVFRFGGPTRYIDDRGHPRLRIRHAPFAVNQAARDHWVQLMDRALTEAAFPPEIDRILREFFASTATFLINRPG
jgi:hemoglobin